MFQKPKIRSHLHMVAKWYQEWWVKAAGTSFPLGWEQTHTAFWQLQQEKALPGQTAGSPLLRLLPVPWHLSSSFGPEPTHSFSWGLVTTSEVWGKGLLVMMWSCWETTHPLWGLRAPVLPTLGASHGWLNYVLMTQAWFIWRGLGHSPQISWNSAIT